MLEYSTSSCYQFFNSLALQLMSNFVAKLWKKAKPELHLRINAKANLQLLNS